jgi:hypothetical protein
MWWPPIIVTHPHTFLRLQMTQPEGSRQHPVGELSICTVTNPLESHDAYLHRRTAGLKLLLRQKRNTNTKLTVSGCSISTPSQHRLFWYNTHFVWMMTALRRSPQTLSRTDVTVTSARDVGSNIFAFRVGHLLAWRSRNQIKQHTWNNQIYYVNSVYICFRCMQKLTATETVVTRPRKWRHTTFCVMLRLPSNSLIVIHWRTWPAGVTDMSSTRTPCLMQIIRLFVNIWWQESIG